MYGSPAGVAALAKTWTDDGSWVDPSAYVEGTNPTLSEITEWLEQVSSIFEASLANEGFTVPVLSSEAPKAVDILDMKVNSFVSDLANYANSKGRLYTERALEVGAMAIINKDIGDYIKNNVTGLEALGIPRIVNLGTNQFFSFQAQRET